MHIFGWNEVDLDTSQYASEWCWLNWIRVDLVEIGSWQYSPSSFGVQQQGEVVFRDNDVVSWGFGHGIQWVYRLHQQHFWRVPMSMLCRCSHTPLLWTKSKTHSDISGDQNYTRVKYSRSPVLRSCGKGSESEGLSFNLCVALPSRPCP